MLLRTLGASLLGNPLTGKSTIRVSEGTITRGKFLMLVHSLINFEIQKMKIKIMKMDLNLTMFIQEVIYLD